MDATDPSARTPSYRVVTRVELRCLLCARTIGSLEAEHWPFLGPMLFRRAGDDLPVRITDWRRLRCAFCGGNPYPDEVATTRVYLPLRLGDDDPPRRGRPPKWLVAARKAQVASGD
jgi:hypothetical protein